MLAVWDRFLGQQERKQFDERLVKMDTKRLCELTSAADSLEMRPLVSACMSTRIKGCFQKERINFAALSLRQAEESPCI